MKYFLVSACIAASFSGGPFSPILQSPSNETAPLSHYFSFHQTKGSSQYETAVLPATLPLGQAHAHNDYEHERPLFDALMHGFNYIEADVWLIDDELYVSHLQPLFLDKTKTLKALYLDPLETLIRQNDGRVFSESDEPLYLMIDIKTGAEETYRALKDQIHAFRSWVTEFENGETKQRAVSIFLSGNRPVETMATESHRLMALDGRIEDLGKGYPASLMPVVSDRFSHVFGWGDTGLVSDDYQWFVFKRLTRIVHAEGKKMRLWASPENESTWEKLLANGADLINTDELGRFRRFLLNRKSMVLQ